MMPARRFTTGAAASAREGGGGRGPLTKSQSDPCRTVEEAPQPEETQTV